MTAYLIILILYHLIPEDTFLLLDALESELLELQSLEPTICLEVGSGSGCVITFLGSLLGASNALYLSTDVNEKAAIASKSTGTQNHIPIDTIRTDLVSSLLPCLSRKVDVLIFNPPYVVTPSEEVGSLGIEAAWAGGVDGREVVDR